MDQSSAPDSFTRTTLITLLVLAPLPVGLVESWSLGAFEFLVGSLFLFWLIASRIRGTGSRRRSPLSLPVIGILAYYFLRLLPLGSIPSPEESHLLTLRSLIPAVSLDEFQLFLTGAIIFFLLTNLARPQDLRTFAIALLATVSVYSLFGLIQYNLSEYLLFGFHRPRVQIGNLSGTYVNPDHFAAVLELAIPLGIGLLVFVFPRSQISKPGDTFIGRIRQRLSQGQEHSLAQYVLIGFLLFTILTSLIFTASRSGIVAGISTIIFYLYRIRTRPQKRTLPRVVIPLLILAFFAGLWIGMEPVFDKFSMTEAQLNSLNGRIPYWKTGLRIFSVHPFFGTGPETTRWVYPRYRDPDSPDNIQISHLHNDYIEFLSENGLVGTFLFVWLCVSYFRGLSSSSTRSRQHSRRRSRVGLLIPAYQAGLFAFLLHAGFDFIFQIPANFFLFIAFVAFSAAGPELQDGSPPLPQAPPPRHVSPVSLIALTLGLFLVIGSLRTGIGGIFHRSLDSNVRQFLRTSRLIPPADVDLREAWRELKLAVQFDPLNPGYRYELGQVLIRLSVAYEGLDTGWGARRGGEMLHADAVRQFQRAVVLNRYDPRSRISLAYLIFPAADPSDPDREETYTLLRGARLLNPAHGKNNLAIGEFYLLHWEHLTPEEKILTVESLNTAFGKMPRDFPGTLAHAWMRIQDYQIVRSLIPDTRWHHTEAARVLSLLGEDDAARSEREQAEALSSVLNQD